MSSSKWLADTVPAFRTLTKAIAGGDTFAVLKLGGTEEYLLDEARAAVLDHLLQDANADFDYYECEGNAIEAGALQEQFSVLPMFGSRRVIVIRDPEGMKKQEPKDVLKNYVARPSPTTSLVMIQPLDRKPNRFEMQRLQSAPNSFWFFELKSDELAKFIRNFVHESGKSIASSAVDYLIENSASQVRDLKAKLEHLVLFAGEEGEITQAMVMRATGVTAEVDLFAFEDALLEGNASRVLREARELLDKGLEPLKLLGRLRLLTQRVWLCGGLANRRATEDDFKTLLGAQVFKKNSFIQAARRIGEPKLRQLQLNLLQIELHAKSRNSDERPLLYEWLWSACGTKNSGTVGTKVFQREFVK